ncbi:MAG TPA: ABC transporter permease [Anaerolineaceae bacterium]|nr:ABC transporter permease [Anaerolineaceae bacterium]HPN52351.1 ABC transporter permease [Anaerolineaceae bacterium]
MDAISTIFKEIWKTLRLIAMNKMGLLGFIMIIFFILMSFVGPYVVAPDLQAHVKEINQGPSVKHPLGTDFQGKDNLVQIVHGGRDILTIAFLAGLMTTFIAVLVGSFSAFFGGMVDTVLMEITNFWITIPKFPILVIVASTAKLTNLWLLALLLAMLSWGGFARQVRSQILSLKKREYVEAAQLLNLGPLHIIFREMLPNMMPFIATSLIFAMTSAIYSQTSLVFLGLVPFSGSNWGIMLSSAFAKGALYQKDAIWSVIAPVGAIALFQLSLVWFSRSLEEVFNPRLRSGV